MCGSACASPTHTSNKISNISTTRRVIAVLVNENQTEKQKNQQNKIRDVTTDITQLIRLTFVCTNMSEVGWHLTYSSVQFERNHIKTGAAAAVTVKEGRQNMQMRKK